MGTFLAHTAVCVCVRHHVTPRCVCVCVCPCLPSLLGHDECSPISTVQAAGRKGKQTQQAAVVDLFIRPQSSSQAPAPCSGPDSQTSKSCTLKRGGGKKPHRWKCVNSRFSFFVSVSLVKTCSSLCGSSEPAVLMEQACGVRHTMTRTRNKHRIRVHAAAVLF